MTKRVDSPAFYEERIRLQREEIARLRDALEVFAVSAERTAAATSRRNHSAFGSKRERQVAEKLRAEGWVVFHNKASRGVCDLVALRTAGNPARYLLRANTTEQAVGGGALWQVRIAPPPAEARLIEVKGTTRSPWVAWGPAERAELVAAAKQAGAVPMLAWWPPHGELQWIGEGEWPS